MYSVFPRKNTACGREGRSTLAPELLQLDAGANATLICLGSVGIIAYTMIVVAIWRESSRKMSPFIIHTSHVRSII